jgi:hypothetical protein
MNNYTCSIPDGNRLCTDRIHTYHQWNLYHSDMCYHCRARRWFKVKSCPFCYKKEKEEETEYCGCKKCPNCGKIIKI